MIVIVERFLSLVVLAPEGPYNVSLGDGGLKNEVLFPGVFNRPGITV